VFGLAETAKAKSFLVTYLDNLLIESNISRHSRRMWRGRRNFLCPTIPCDDSFWCLCLAAELTLHSHQPYIQVTRHAFSAILL
jgi:hypothetical protein